MKIRVLGCSTSDLSDVNLSSFLVDNQILFDAGTILSMIQEDEIWNIDQVVITHAHLDHVKDLPFFAETVYLSDKDHTINVISVPMVTDAIKNNLMNNVIWPDFSQIPSQEKPIIKYENIDIGIPFHANGYKITAYKVNHSVSAVGYLIEDKKGISLLYPGDLGPSNTIWKSMGSRKLNGLIIEASFPNRLRDLALKTGHLTPELLSAELQKLEHMPEKIFITHCKPQYKQTVENELKELNIHNIHILQCGARFEL